MSNTNILKVPSVLIGNGATSGTPTKLSDVTKGGLYLVKSDGTIQTAASADDLTKDDTVFIASCFEDGKIIKSAPIKGTDVKTYVGSSYVAPVQQVSYVGFNGTDGSLPTTVNTDYRLRLTFKGTHVLSTRSPWFADSIYTSGATTTQAQVAAGIVDNYYINNKAANPYAVAERVSNAAKTAVPTGTTSFTFKKGSNVVSCAGDIDDATGGTALAVGAYLVIGATDDKDPVYKIASIDTTNNILTLDTPYVGASATILDDALLQSTGAAVAAGDLGIKLTGQPIEQILPDYDRYSITMFDVAFSDMANQGALDIVAQITYDTKPVLGNGYYKQVRIDERASQTYNGWHAKTSYDHKKPVSLVDETDNYDSITIESNVHMLGDFRQYTDEAQVTKIYIPVDPATQGTEFTAILNAYFSTVLGFTAISL